MLESAVVEWLSGVANLQEGLGARLEFHGLVHVLTRRFSVSSLAGILYLHLSLGSVISSRFRL